MSRSWRRFDGDEHDFRAWFYSIARSVSIDSYRRTGRRAEQLVADVEPCTTERRAATEDGAFEAFGTDRALALLATLPTDQADAIALRVIAGLNADRVAEIMGKRPGHVRVLQHRGLRRLALLLEARGVQSHDVTQ